MSISEKVEAATKALDDLVNQAAGIAGDGNMGLKGFMVYEMIDSDGDYNLGYLHTTDSPRWAFVGPLTWALDRMRALSPGETEIDFLEDDPDA